MSKYPVPFGRHLLLERINVGGMAEVFKAKAFGVEGFERVVAVKRILPTLVSDQEFITMFIDEARIAAHLTHQNIVQIYELGKHEETFFISMEYVAGKDLRQMLDFQKKLKKPMAIPKACFIVSRVCEALEYAHRKKDPAGRDLKIIHRDVTPQNVIISYEGEVKLCDFGIAKAASRVSRTQVGVLKGKFAYMSPEQVRGQPTDRRSDIFALGVILYEMLTGERLFLSESDYSTLEAVRNAVIPPPRQHNEAISEELEAVMLKMLAADPRNRYQWASEVHEELLDHLVHNNRLYHGRHLRQGMQETYGRAIEIENEKLEAFMRLKMPIPDEEPVEPSPSNVVMALAEERPVALRDPADEAVPDDDLGGPTDSFAIPNQPFSPDDDTESAASIEETVAPTLAGASPVAHLFGAPELDQEDAEEAALTDGEMVVVASGSDQRAQIETSPITEEEAVVDGGTVEQTQYDAVAPENDTLFDDGNETVMGDDRMKAEIDAAQAELMSHLDAVGAIDGETLDAAELSQESVAPQVYDPAESDEEAPTFHGDELPPGVIRDFDDLPDDSETNISPLILDDVQRQSGSNPSAEIFESDDGTLEDAEAFIPTHAGAEEDATSDLNPATVEPHSRPRRIRSWARTESAPQRRPSPPPGMRGPGREPGIKITPVSEDQARPFAPQFSSDEPSGLGSQPRPVPPHVEVRSQPFGGPRLLMLLAGGVGLLAATLLGVVVLALRPDAASLQIVTEPTRTVDVLLDGKLVAQETPVDIDDVELGAHHIELRAKDYLPYRQTVNIAEAKPHTMVVPLERRTVDEAPNDQDALPEGDAIERDLEDVPEGAKTEAAPPLKPAPDAAQVAATIERRPPIDPEPAPRPDPAALAGDDTDAARGSISPPPPPAPPQRPRKPATGTLMVSTRPPGVAVFINDADTGLRTPIRKPYELPVGRHTITFVLTNGKKYSYAVTIQRGQNTKLMKLLR